MNKKEFGQFYTTNYEYILQNMKIPKNVKNIIEPFAGNCDLIKFIDNKKEYNIELYDIEPKNKNIIKKDTLKNPPNYDDKFILTNPPYLARNKNKNKELYDLYKCNDLYKCFILNLIDSECYGGIIIIPLNFISSIRKNDVILRKKFIEKFDLKKINIFEEQVFDDTKYSVCCISFRRRKEEKQNITKIYVYPNSKKMDVLFDKNNNFTIGGEIYNLPYDKEYKIERATKLTKNKNKITNILLKCIDDSKDNKLCLKIVKDEEIFIDETKNLSARSYATLVVNKDISLKKQKLLVKEFNKLIEEYRDKYNSLFLTNFRESNSIARKRISFDLSFKICNYILSSIIKL